MELQPSTCYNISMGIFISVIILVLITLIQLFMQLTPGTLALFYHYALGKNTFIKADNFCLHFILGAEVFVGGLWLIIYLLLLNLIGEASGVAFKIVPWVLFGVFIAEAIASVLFYYRRGKYTELYIPRSIVKGITDKAKSAKTRSDAFVLGFIVGAFELVFTLPIYIAGVTALLASPALPRGAIIILFVVISVIPLFIMRTLFRVDHNLAEVEKHRVKRKTFIKIGMCVTFVLLAAAMAWLGVQYG